MYSVWLASIKHLLYGPIKGQSASTRICEEPSICTLERTAGETPHEASILRPQLLRSPAAISTGAFVKGIAESPSLLRVAQVCLLNRVRDDNDKAEVFPGNIVLKIVRFGAQLKILIIVRLIYWLAWWRCFERA
jgi:hypothetical protein